MIKAIECRYASRRFRSRREARWAILFDHLDIDWRYEPEGYHLPGNICYLPDFELHLGNEQRIWVEVKPELQPYGPLSSLVQESGQTGVIVAEPMLKSDVMLCAPAKGGPQLINSAEWLAVVTGNASRSAQLQIQAASNAALSARWEHGEQPRRPRKPGGRGPRTYIRPETLLNERQLTANAW